MGKKSTLSGDELKLYNELEKLSRKANLRIRRLERIYGKESWGIKKLKGYLDTVPLGAWTEGGRIRVSKNFSTIQMKAIKKEVEKFLSYKSSTVRGVNQIRKEQIKNIQEEFQMDVSKDFTYKDAENMYDIFDSNYNWILEYMTPSKFKAMTKEAIAKKDTPKRFYQRINTILNDGNSNDNDLKLKAMSLWIKFIKPYI